MRTDANIILGFNVFERLFIFSRFAVIRKRCLLVTIMLLYLGYIHVLRKIPYKHIKLSTMLRESCNITIVNKSATNQSTLSKSAIKSIITLHSFGYLAEKGVIHD